MGIFESTKTDGNFASATNTFTTVVQKHLYLKDQMPDIKVIDFLTALFKMFNLTSFFVDNTIKVQPLQDFYAASTTVHDITEHLDLDTSEVTYQYHTITLVLNMKVMKPFLQLSITNTMV